jgi:hypothetical protein
MNSPASEALSQRLERLAWLRNWRLRCKKTEIQNQLDKEIKMNEPFEKLAAKFCPPNAIGEARADNAASPHDQTL